MNLDDLHEVVDRCLYLPNKTTLHVSLATVAVNLYHPPGQDPVWLLLVDAGSSGKSIIIDACAQIDGCYEATDLTIPGFLSGVPGKERETDATGGLLRVVGHRGMLLNSDFTVCLGMHRDRRAEFFPFLRTVYDGRVDRSLGSGGGKTYSWRGHVGFLAGVTEIVDRHQQDMASGGERFLYYRLPPITTTQADERLHFQYNRQPANYRAQLADAVREFVTPDRLRPPRLPKDMADVIIGLAQLAATAASPVERDYRTKELIDFGNPTRPDRMLKQLFGLRWGLRYIGRTEQQAMREVAAVAISCIPRIKGKIIDYLASVDDSNALGVATAIGRPHTTVGMALEDLSCFQVVYKEKIYGGPGQQNRWWLDPHYKAVYNTAV